MNYTVEEKKTEETETTETETKGLKAKTVSLIVKIFIVVFCVSAAVLKWLGVFKSENVTIGEICAIGGICGAVFGDVSINTAIDKFRSSKNDSE